MLNINKQLGQAKGTNFFSDILAFGLRLTQLSGEQFISIAADYDLNEKLLVNKRGSGRGKNGIPCPFKDRGLRKLAKSQARLVLDYDKLRESRGGDAPQSEGNWIQTVVIEGKPTIIATHKDDVETRLKDGIDPNSEEASLIKNRVAVLDEKGSVQFNTETPRLYLRYEQRRHAGDGERFENQVASKSIFIIDGGTLVDDAELADYLPVPKPRSDNTDFQLVTLDNLVAIKIAGESWEKRDYSVPKINGQTFESIAEAVDKLDKPKVKPEAIEQPGEQKPDDAAQAIGTKAKTDVKTPDLSK